MLVHAYTIEQVQCLFFSHIIFNCLNQVQFKHVIIIVDIFKYIRCRKLHISTKKQVN
jgi:hypothetical protein